MKPIDARRTINGTWEVELENGQVISNVYAGSYSEALENVKDTPEYLPYMGMERG
ncbi:hypothetical protein J2S00_003046 [Caldalkalibacillus uzonensis]|uniref:Uncharacterized protein n=1 Tax=Caldalkalibacillus uzonensis TaxID=353224 RepID=A0ABU0CUY9_9BACI|nr:hypothetical protein [Caldalkalibacillus uzonensis]MDQ0340241.1 hypothetical protein [Caldalkalibacillus uzonensis]